MAEPDVMYMIAMRIEAGMLRNSPQLTKDRRVLKKAEAEIRRLRAENAALKELANSERMSRYLK